MISGSAPFLPSAISTAESGAAMWACPARIGQRRQLPDPAAGLYGRDSLGLFHLPLRHIRRVRLLARFFQKPKELEEPVRVMEQTRIYPLGKRETAKPMQFPDASLAPADMLIRRMVRPSTCCPGSSIMNTSIPPRCLCVAWQPSSGS